MANTDCPICGFFLGDGGLEIIGSGPPMTVYKSWCPQCRINLMRGVNHLGNTVWTTPDLDGGSVTRFLEEIDLAYVHGKLSRYPNMLERWQTEFVAIRQEGDLIGIIPSDTEGYIWLALLRNNLVVAAYDAPSGFVPTGTSTR